GATSARYLLRASGNFGAPQPRLSESTSASCPHAKQNKNKPLGVAVIGAVGVRPGRQPRRTKNEHAALRPRRSICPRPGRTGPGAGAAPRTGDTGADPRSGRGPDRGHDPGRAVAAMSEPAP